MFIRQLLIIGISPLSTSNIALENPFLLPIILTLRVHKKLENEANIKEKVVD